MITAAEPPSHRASAFAGSLVVHAALLALVAALVPAWGVFSSGNLLRESTACLRPCGIVTIRVAVRSAAAALALPLHAASAQPRYAARATALPSPLQVVIVGAANRAGESELRPTTLAFNPPIKIVAVPALAPPISQSLDAIPRLLTEKLAAGNWGSRFDSPTLRDRALLRDLLAKLPKGGSVVVVVDDRGRATDVQITASGLDAATISDLRARLLAASYAPVERDGVAFSGSLRISR